MEKLNNIKVAIFDFDDTLAIHKDKDFSKHRNENENTLLNYYLNAYINPECFYESIETCTVSEVIPKLVNSLRKNNVKIYCVSGMRFSFHLKAKEYFVHKYYGCDIEVISTGSQELKVEAAKIISKVNNCKLNEMLFVDDRKENITNLKNIGGNAILTDEVGILMNEVC